MNREEFESFVDRVIEDLPAWVVERIDNLHIVVEEQPPPGQEGLLGIYEGVSLPERSADYWGVLPDRIVVFRRPHLALGLSRAGLEDEIRKTVLHEIAHHIGIGDDRLVELGWD